MNQPLAIPRGRGAPKKKRKGGRRDAKLRYAKKFRREHGDPVEAPGGAAHGDTATGGAARVSALASAREEPLQAGLQGLLPAPPRNLPRVVALASAREEPLMPKRAFHARRVVVVAAAVDKVALRAARA